ncbi:MAG TPA: glycosyltransferase family 4 protein [Pyrinomonadaceae bacterium]|nr:glycosyltransferase family 4 protein [Pyrinomonadaceae bacterium]
MDQKRRKIVFVWNYTSWGGAQVYLLAVMKLAQPDWDLEVILPAASNAQIFTYLEQLGVPYDAVPYHLDLDPAPTLSRKLSRQKNRLKVELATFRRLLKYDTASTVFHIEISPWQSVAFLSAMAMRRAKVFVTFHNAVPDGSALRQSLWRARLWFTSYLSGLNFFASNGDTKERLKGWVNDSFWERIRVTFTAVNPPEIDNAANAQFDRRETLERIGVDTEDLIVLAVGNFVDRKGRWVFLDAAQNVLKTAEEISFVWLTPLRPSAEDEERIAGYGLGSKFRLVNADEVGHERIDILKFFRIADVFTLPSYVEGLPIALLEAMALERPSISTNVFGIPEAVIHEKTGLLIEAGDSAGLAESILRLKRDPELRRKVATNGRAHVLKHFDERDAAASVIQAYTEALNGR